LACAYGNIPFEDIRLTHESFGELKQEGKFPFGQVPVLEIDGKVVGQTGAIVRYIGKRAGLYPLDDDFQAAVIDSILDQDIDSVVGLLITSPYRSRSGFGAIDNDIAEAIRKDIFANVFPKYFGYYEEFLKKSRSGWLAGGEGPSIADFIIVARLKYLASGVVDHLPTDFLDNFPKLQELVAKYNALPAVVNYYESHKK